MKNKWIFISITLFVMLIGSLVYIFVTNKPKTIEISEYSCSGILRAGDNEFPLNSVQKIKVDTTGTIVEKTTYVTYGYDSKETYEAASKIYKALTDANVTYEYDEENYTITSVVKTTSTTIIEEDGSEVEIWYKNYIKTLEKQNYTCKKLNS